MSCYSVAYRGNLSASKMTVSMPSLAKAEAAYEPAGPPPTTRTVHFSGMAIFLAITVYCYDEEYG
jgi:hypothetical protein